VFFRRFYTSQFANYVLATGPAGARPACTGRVSVPACVDPRIILEGIPCIDYSYTSGIGLMLSYFMKELNLFDEAQ